jgi:hypothetical protein
MLSRIRSQMFSAYVQAKLGWVISLRNTATHSPAAHNRHKRLAPPDKGSASTRLSRRYLLSLAAAAFSCSANKCLTLA